MPQPRTDLPANLPAWRSLLFVPVTRDKFVASAHTRGADAIILDLEDSVAESEKPRGRTLIHSAAAQVSKGGADVLVRINRPWHHAFRDIEAAVGPGVAGAHVPQGREPRASRASSPSCSTRWRPSAAWRKATRSSWR